jgi:hypothetical protein
MATGDIQNKTFSGQEVAGQLDNLSGARNRAYVNCTFQDYVGTVAHGNCGNGVRFTNCTFKRLKGTPSSLFFPGSDWKTSRDNYDLKWINCTFEECEGPDLFEFKCSGSEIINCRFVRCKGGVRIRHGVGTKVENCIGLTRVKVRCGPHLIVNCPQADVVVYAGNLPGEDGEWQPLHEHGEGHNMQCAFRVEVTNVKSVALGFHFGNKDDKYPATQCKIAPPGVPVKGDYHTNEIKWERHFNQR